MLKGTCNIPNCAKLEAWNFTHKKTSAKVGRKGEFPRTLSACPQHKAELPGRCYNLHYMCFIASSKHSSFQSDCCGGAELCLFEALCSHSFLGLLVLLSSIAFTEIVGWLFFFFLSVLLNQSTPFGFYLGEKNKRNGLSWNFNKCVGADSGGGATHNEHLLCEMFMPRNHIPDHFRNSRGAFTFQCAQKFNQEQFWNFNWNWKQKGAQHPSVDHSNTEDKREKLMLQNKNKHFRDFHWASCCCCC